MDDTLIVADVEHILHRMVRHALGILRDAAVLRTELRPQHSPGEYFLRLTAAEILLKAGYLEARGALPKGHDFLKLFEHQPSEIQDSVRTEFNDRELWNTISVGAPVEDQLRVLGENFVQFRYQYEGSVPFTEAEDQERVDAFLAGELPVEEWDTIYYSPVLDILLRASLAYLSNWRPSDLPPVEEWEC